MDDNEIEQLLAALDTSNTGHVGRGALLASLIDWNDFSTRCRDQWLSLLRRQFEGLDLNRDGRVSVDDMIETLRGKLSPQELSLAADRIRFESGIVEGSLNEDIDFETFARVMDVGQDYAFRDLDLFDDRVPLTPTSAPDPNVRGGNLFPSLLEPVAEN